MAGPSYQIAVGLEECQLYGDNSKVSSRQGADAHGGWAEHGGLSGIEVILDCHADHVTFVQPQGSQPSAPKNRAVVGGGVGLQGSQGLQRILCFLPFHCGPQAVLL